MAERTWQQRSHLNQTTSPQGWSLLGPGALGATTFALGVLTGLILNGPVRKLYQRARHDLQHRGSQTVVYDENLPPSLSRREPASPDQPRFGGTGALGVSPRAVDRTLGRVEQP